MQIAVHKVEGGQHTILPEIPPFTATATYWKREKYSSNVAGASHVQITARKAEAEREQRKKERMEKDMRDLKAALEARQTEIKQKQLQVGEGWGYNVWLCKAKSCTPSTLQPVDNRFGAWLGRVVSPI